jgi:serine/threonine protein phosphatase 1
MMEVREVHLKGPFLEAESLQSTSRMVAIGDIHGCFRAFDALLNEISPAPTDTLITLGDYTSRGDESRQVLDRLIKLSEECQLVPILGNHDEMMLEARNGTVEKSRWIDSGGFETMMSYGPDVDLRVVPEAHWQFLKSCVPYFETDKHFFVHANYDHRLPLDQQDEWTLRWMSLDDAFPKAHCAGKCAVLGHTPQMTGEILDRQYLKAVDTGCGFGGRLTAFEVGSGQTWQVAENGSAVA